MQEQTQLYKPCPSVCLSHVSSHPTGQSSGLSEGAGSASHPQEESTGKSPSRERGHREAGRTGGIEAPATVVKDEHSLTSNSLHLLFPLPELTAQLQYKVTSSCFRWEGRGLDQN